MLPSSACMIPQMPILKMADSAVLPEKPISSAGKDFSQRMNRA